MIHAESPPAWLLLVHVLPPRPSSIRVRTWRRLKGVGAVALKQAVWALPNTDQSREDFEWIRAEIHQLRGEATVFAADVTDAYSSDEIAAAFRSAREADYAALGREAATLARAARSARGRAARARRVRHLAERLDRIGAITFLAPDNREAVVAAIARLQAELAPLPRPGQLAETRVAADFRGRRWVTRPRPGIDRMSSAWLIRRFIDPRARFAFAHRAPAGRRTVSFDMSGATFGHTEHGCTFETLLATFGLRSSALDRIARIVHDVDLKDRRFSPPEAPAFSPIVDGLRRTSDDDAELLERGIALFEAVHASFAS